MGRQTMNPCVALVSTVFLSLGVTLLSGCTTTPDETYKKSEMAKPLDYPPDLVAPVTNKRFSVPPPGSAPVSTPVSLPETPPAARKPANRRGGHSH